MCDTFKLWALLLFKNFSLAWGLESELQKIKENLEVIKPVLLDAEQQLSQNPWVEIWLENLKQVLYDAEDVVDDFEYEALRRKVTRKVRRFFSSPNPLAFHFKTGHKVKKIRERIDKIAALKSKFGLTERIFHRHVIHKKREMTHSFIDASNVIGREEAKFTIIEMLLQFVDGENVISIIPIVGVGGLGKTTLAKLVYNDQRRGPQKWLDLKSLLMGGSNGSRIVVTTRSNRVAEIMGKVSPHNLSLLHHQYLQEGKQNPNFTRIRGEIVRKCKGVPLALLSYEHLPSYLKRCFAYYIDLVYLWMANGLVQSSNENQEFEDVGLRYFEVLCSRCFFLDFSEYGGNVRCKMHELIHDLALSITQNEYSMFIGSTQQFAKSLRHVSFPYPESLSKVVPKSLQNLDCMRTICCINERGDGISSEVFKSTIKRLPNSICKVQSLQVLLLFGCWNLKELPKDIKCMINLRLLWVTTHQKCFSMGGIGCLKALRSLFITECPNLEYLFEYMLGLQKLRRLAVSSCRSLISLPRSIKCLTALDREDTQFRLHKLELRELPKLVDFPQWLIQGFINSLKVLEVAYCDNLRELPNCLQNMACLQELQFIDCTKLNNNPL
ncbi:hypothetical protein MANES_09G010450v8 [Manihot esculenta]|uniref:Uncharacterized protein n=1 Tax=Manihot esculenta TaxID=3983 RepID=A0ACC8D3A0_MANES|nr:hypothetical protein MANES_09G010450v8 [Manihot esculenta]